jgi:t-SNARE complex subunit (syntaxin)
MKYDELEKEMKELKESMDILHDMVQEQQPRIDSIEDYIEQSKEEITEGISDINETVKQKETTSWTYMAISLTMFVLYLII